MTTTIVIPGTLYRCYADDGRHWTAVIRSGGTVMEVKNPDAGAARGSTFDTVEAWSSARGCSRVEADSSKVSGIREVKDTHGFKYDWSKRMWSRAMNWIYEMIEEGAPHLLEREDVRNEFNKLVDMFEQYKDGMECYVLRKFRYEASSLIPCNLPFCYPVQYGTIVPPKREGYSLIQSTYSNGLHKHLGDVIDYMKRVTELKWRKKYLPAQQCKLHRKYWIFERAKKEYEAAKVDVEKSQKRIAELEMLIARK